MKVALGVEYVGTNYHGWQRQPEQMTVQATLESALAKVAAQDIQLHCAGRTDAGVHAISQVVHFETSVDRELKAWVLGTNTYLPDDIKVLWSREVAEGFHARFSALSRTYRYLIYNSAVRSALLHQRVCHCYRNLNHNDMHEAGQFLLGEHDFTSFRAAQCQSKTPMRNVQQIRVKRQDKLIIIEITANAFLHHMVRNIVGMLIEIGLANRTIQWADTVLKAQDREINAAMATGDGLYLAGVNYPEYFLIPNTEKESCLSELNFVVSAI